LSILNNTLAFLSNYFFLFLFFFCNKVLYILIEVIIFLFLINLLGWYDCCLFLWLYIQFLLVFYFLYHLECMLRAVIPSIFDCLIDFLLVINNLIVAFELSYKSLLCQILRYSPCLTIGIFLLEQKIVSFLSSNIKFL